MSLIFEKLPGIPLPISEVPKQLRGMWKGEQDHVSAAPSEFRASQLNLIIHFGMKTPVEEANDLFSTAIEFTQRHPGRIIVLCPTDDSHRVQEMNGKLFTQCYIGESQREMCCCEALLLEYCPDDPHSLFNQVSVWLENDLPVYHWFHRVPVRNIKNKHLSFVKNCKRVLFDSQIEQDDYTDIPIPDSWRLRDLADARMLPVKQSIGQILSTYDESGIVDGLVKVKISCSNLGYANAVQLKRWFDECLSLAIGTKQSNERPAVEVVAEDVEDQFVLVNFEYINDQFFYWKCCERSEQAKSEASIGGRKSEHSVIVRQSDATTLLSEAIFFGR